MKKNLIFLCMFAILSGCPTLGQTQSIFWEFVLGNDGVVHVTVTPKEVSEVVVPITLQNLQVQGSKYDVVTFKNYTTTIKLSKSDANSVTIEYDWPDGALPSYKKESLWFFDTFRLDSSSSGKIILPAETFLIKKDFRDCEGQVVQQMERIEISFRAAGKRLLIRLVYNFPWKEKFKKEQLEHLTIYYPDVQQFRECYSAILDKFVNDSYATYQKYREYLHWAPDSVDICFVHPTAVWHANPIAGACTYMGKHPIIWYPYRALAGYEFPPPDLTSQDDGNVP